MNVPHRGMRRWPALATAILALGGIAGILSARTGARSRQAALDGPRDRVAAEPRPGSAAGLPLPSRVPVPAVRARSSSRS